MFRLDNVSLTLNTNRVLQNVSLAIEPGQMHVVVGPNGAGKSTLLKVLTGELAPTSGQVFCNGRPIGGERPEALAAMRAVMPQSSHLSFPFTVYEVAAMGLGRDVPHSRQQTVIMDGLEQVGLHTLAGRYYQQLSGGEQQRVQLARVLVQIGQPVQDGAPRYLFLDEPIANLDLSHQQRILEIARSFARQGGGVFVILHDINIAARYADRLIILAHGQVEAAGPPQDVLTRSILERVWNIEMALLQVPGSAMPVFLPQVLARGEAR